jgi:hypothetical protein
MLGEWYLPPGECQVISTITEGTISISRSPFLSTRTPITQIPSLQVDTPQRLSTPSLRRSGGLNLAIAHNNLSELFIELGHLSEARPHFTRAVANFDKLVAEVPKSMDYQHVFGIVLAGQAKLLNRTDKPVDAKAALTAAVEYGR